MAPGLYSRRDTRPAVPLGAWAHSGIAAIIIPLPLGLSQLGRQLAPHIGGSRVSSCQKLLS